MRRQLQVQYGIIDFGEEDSEDEWWERGWNAVGVYVYGRETFDKCGVVNYISLW